MKPTVTAPTAIVFAFPVIHSHWRTLDVFPKNFQQDIPEQITNGLHFI